MFRNTILRFHRAFSSSNSDIIGKVSSALKESLKEFNESDYAEPTVPKEDFNSILNLNKSIAQNLQLGNMKEANQQVRESLELSCKYYQPYHPVVLSGMNNLAIILKVKNPNFYSRETTSSKRQKQP